MLAVGVSLSFDLCDAIRERRPETVQDIVEVVRQTCRAEFPLKHAFVDLNGLWARATGRRLCNGVFRRPDGMLVRAKVAETLDVATCEAGLVSFARDLKDRDVRLVYVQLPGKPDRGGEKLMTLTDALLAGLATNGVETIDLRDRYAGTPERLRRYFFRTDHHWNLDAVKDAAEILAKSLGDAQGAYAADGWERLVLPDWFLGSQGKRTGVWFGGVDDLAYWRQRQADGYAIELTAADGSRTLSSGNFDVNFDGQFAHERGDVHLENAYKICRGIGGITPAVRHLHGAAPIRRRVALIGDSFVRPLEAYLAVAVSDVLAVDPRYPCGRTSVREKVLAFKPDVVMVCLNPFAFVKNKGAYPPYAFCEFP